MRVSILAPIRNSPYARNLCHLLAQEQGIELTDVIVRTPWTYRRIRQELLRDGPRLIRKAYKKIALGDRNYDPRDADSYRAMAQRNAMPGKTLGDLARVHGFRLTVVRDHNDQRGEHTLREACPDVVAFTGGGLIRKNILDIPPHGVLNCHMGVLPPWRGMDVVEWAVLENSQPTPQVGLTLHVMDRGVDTGPILFVRNVELRPGDTYNTIRQRMGPQMVQAMFDAIVALRDSRAEPQPQRLEDGKQFFIMHPRVYALAQQRLKEVVSGIAARPGANQTS